MQLDPHTALRTAEQLGRERRELAANNRLRRLLRTPATRAEVPPPTAHRDPRPDRIPRPRRVAVGT
jgi:hypothetical protein